MQYEFHPLANLFPLIEGEDFAALVADVKANGLHEPIDIYQGKILDGRNRYRAICAAGLELEKRLFRTFRPEFYGDAVSYVISKNIQRRHLSVGQRAYAMAEVEILRHGGARKVPVQQDANLRPEDDASPAIRAELAATGHISERSIASAAVVRDHGIDELKAAVKQAALSVSAAESIARMPEPEQREAVKTINGARAIAARRTEPPDSLDFAPTPPWATRALIRHVFGVLPECSMKSIWEPACGEGHMAEVLREEHSNVLATDIHPYGYSEHPPCNFLSEEAADYENREWIITNPPYGDSALPFVLKALERATVGVAMFVRSQWAVEGVERYEAIFRRRPPYVCAFFTERVPLSMGRWEPDGSTLTAYCWLVWVKDALGCSPRAFWIPPGCRKSLEHPGDRERFTAHPVLPRVVEPVKAIERPVAKPPLPEIEIPEMLRGAGA